MKTIEITSKIKVFEKPEELSQEQHKLVQEAIKATKDAYAPYSEFFVGAAVLLNNGKIILGNNQENAAYPSGLCAERTALFHVGAKYKNEIIKSIAITAQSEKHQVNKPVIPCGGCLQVILEYEVKQNSPIEFILFGTSGEIYVINGIKNLLPLQFSF